LLFIGFSITIRAKFAQHKEYHNLSQASSAKAGVIFAICAYTMWGIAPIYFKSLMSIPAAEVLMHRVVWSALVLVVLISLVKQWHKIRTALQSTKVIVTLLCAGMLLALNWLLFIWAVNNDRLLESSLGYYINPLINVFFGRLFLGEVLRPVQKLAVAIAAVGVAIMIFNYGQVPWIALTLAVTFSVYGLLRKQVAVDSMPGLLIETMMMLPIALVYWFWFAQVSGNLVENDNNLNLLLMAAGIVTTAPLLCFTAAARRIKYSTLGFFQYIGPSIMFCLAVLVYHEPLSQARLITFGFVWFALAVFSYDSLNQYRRDRKTRKLAAMAEARPTTMRPE